MHHGKIPVPDDCDTGVICSVFIHMPSAIMGENEVSTAEHIRRKARIFWTDSDLGVRRAMENAQFA